MGQKTISLSEDAYNRIKHAKKQDESFSSFILRTVHVPETQDLIEFAGVFKDDSDYWVEMEKTIYHNRSAHPELDEENLGD